MDDFFGTDFAGSAVCDECGERLSPDATFCPNCGSRRMSKRDIDDTELPFQYVTPRIQNEAYTSIESEDDFLFGYDAEDYGTDDFSEDPFVTQEFGEEYSDYAEAMNLSHESDKRPAAKKRPATKKHSAAKTKRRASSGSKPKDGLADADSRKSAIAVLIAAGFLGIVLIVSLLGFIVSLFSGSGNVQTVVDENTDTSSVVSSISSSAPSEVTSSSAPADKPVVHLLPEDVRNDSYTKYKVDQNTYTTVMASSFIDAKLTHGSTELAFDGDIETSWQDGVKGYGVGEWLLAYNSDGSAVKVSEVTVYNGYQNPKFNTAKKDMYLVNSRVSDFTLTFDDGTSESFTLEDIKEPQTFKFKERETCYIRFTVGGAYKGTKYKDTCITEIIYK